MQNAIDIFTLNKHSDYPEVVFSSALSYVLNPSNNLPWGDAVLRAFFKAAGFAESTFSHPEFSSEKRLGNLGTIDIFIEDKKNKRAMGIEVKIRDKSAKNANKEDKTQLVRYGDFLKNNYGVGHGSWRLVYVVPFRGSPKCTQEFKKAEEKYGPSVVLLPWNSLGAENSVRDILKGIKADSKEIPGWILRSLEEKIPSIIEQIPDPGRFPGVVDLKKSDLWPMFESLFEFFKRYPTTLHTTVGIPYGVGNQKSKSHDNCLFRVRVSKKYYKEKEAKEKNIPAQHLEVELWEDVWKGNKEEIHAVINELTGAKIESGTHIDEKSLTGRGRDITVVKIPFQRLSKTWLAEFETALKKGFQKI